MLPRRRCLADCGVSDLSLGADFRQEHDHETKHPRSPRFPPSLALTATPPIARAQTPAEYAQTASYAAAHQNKDGGFGGTPGQLSSLGATNSGLRVLKHVGGSVPDILGCIKYVRSCHDAASGGFAPTPGGKPDVVTTALGLMAASELKIADPAMVKAAADYLGKNAKSFEEVRMAIAGLEAVHGTSPDFFQME